MSRNADRSLPALANPRPEQLGQPIILKAWQRVALAAATLFSFLVRLRGMAFADWFFSRVLRVPLLDRKLFGFTITLIPEKSAGERALILDGERAVVEAEIFDSIVRPGMHCIDVGANIGYYALMLRRLLGPAGKLTLFEPDPDNFDRLTGLIQSNDFQNVEALNCAVGARTGTVLLEPGLNAHIAASAPKKSGESGEGPRVDLVSLDSMIDGRIDLIKIDVEGYEAEVLAGACELIRKWHPVLFVEIHPYELRAFSANADSVMGMLCQHYSRIRVLVPSERRFRSRITRALSRYLLPPVTEIRDRDGFLEKVRNAPAEPPFWAVCT